MISDQDEANRLLAKYAAARSRLEAASASLQDALAKVNAAYLDEMVRVQRSVQECEAALRDFAKSHQRELSGDLRSYENGGWRFGYRMRRDSVKLLADEDVAISVLRKTDPRFEFLFVRPRYELDREAIIRFLRREADDQFEFAAPVERFEVLLENAGVALKRGKDKFFIEEA